MPVITEQSRGSLKFFANSIHDLLFDYTPLVYCAPTMNSQTLLWELQATSRDVVDGSRAQGCLKPLILECIDSVRNDPILNNEDLLLLRTTLENIQNSSPETCLSKSIFAYQYINKNYWSLLKEKCRTSIIEGEDYPSLYTLARVLCAGTEINGFSRRFLFNLSKNLSRNLKRSPSLTEIEIQLENFFHKLDSKPSEWTLAFRSNSTSNAYEDVAKAYGIDIQPHAPLTLTRKKVWNKINADQNFDRWAIIKVPSARDDAAAKSTADRVLSGFTSMCRFHNHRLDLQFSHYAIVLNHSSCDVTIAGKAPSAMLRGTSHSEEIEETITTSLAPIVILLSRNLDQEDSRNLHRALEFHRIALDTESPEIQLVSLWSGLEAILSHSDKDNAKVSYIGRVISACCTDTYFDRKLGYLHNIFKHKIGCQDVYKDTLSNLHSDIENLAATLACPEYEDSKNELIRNLSNSSHWLYHTEEMSKIISSPKIINKHIERYRNRVQWQVQRIYGARNLIVHKAQRLPYIEPLTQCLHTYFDILVNCLGTAGEKMSHRSMELCTLSELMLALDDRYTQMLRQNQQKDTIVGSEISAFLKLDS